jgi:peptidoglycan/xylan/chitin deacetylase (PgdA/CDA1 family)
LLDASGAPSANLGATHVVRAVLGTPIRDVPLPPLAERVLIELREPDTVPTTSAVSPERGLELADVTLPASGPIVPALVAADALADEIAWDLLGRLLDETVRESLELCRSGDSLAVSRGPLQLGSASLDVGASDSELTLEAAGWVLFMQELWGLPDLGIDDFYDDIDVAMDSEPPVLVVEPGTITVVEVAERLPLITTAAENVVVQVALAGLPLMALRIPSPSGIVTAQRIRRSINLEGKFELCQVAMREAVLLSGWPVGTPLRARLSELAARRRRAVAIREAAGLARLEAEHEALFDEFVPVGHRAVIFGRRPSRNFVSAACRPATFPLESRVLTEAMAQRSGQLVAEHGDPQLPQMAMYLPYLFDPQPAALDIDPDVEPRLAEFEAEFAEEDPWQYGSAYEQRKYEETLALLPRRIRSALEVGCAEGVFTQMLAERVDRLTAVDISPTAIARARARSANLGNVEFLQLDLFSSEPFDGDDLEGRFDVVVCGEVLYYAPDLAALRRGLKRLIQALKPGGSLVVVHANLVVDQPDEPGFDWDHLIGAAGIERELAATRELSLSGDRRSVYYRAQRWQSGAGGPSRIPRRRSRKLTDVPAPGPIAARTWLPTGGEVDRTSELHGTANLPVLMYHRVAPETPAAAARWATSPWAFEEQLAWLRDQKYESVSIDEWAVACANDVVLPGRRVLITFDDGFQDFADHALPLLTAYGFCADMHIVTGHVGGSNAWEAPGFPSYQLMDWQTILDLPRQIVTIGSHTVSHAACVALDPVTAMDEMLRSRAELEDRLGRSVTRIAYPYGSIDESTPNLALASGYEYAYTTDERLADRDRKLLRIPRLEVRGGLSIDQFSRLVTTGELDQRELDEERPAEVVLEGSA